MIRSEKIKQLGIIFSVGADVYRLNVCVLEASTFSFEKRIDMKSQRIEGTMVGINREHQILNNFSRMSFQNFQRTTTRKSLPLAEKKIIIQSIL